MTSSSLPPSYRVAGVVFVATLIASTFTLLVSPITGVPALACFALTVDGPTLWWEVVLTGWFAILVAAPFPIAFSILCRWLHLETRPQPRPAALRAVSAASHDIAHTLGRIRPLLEELRGKVDNASRATEEVERLAAM